jgi:hypothetical protein
LPKQNTANTYPRRFVEYIPAGDELRDDMDWVAMQNGVPVHTKGFDPSIDLEQKQESPKIKEETVRVYLPHYLPEYYLIKRETIRRRDMWRFRYRYRHSFRTCVTYKRRRDIT